MKNSSCLLEISGSQRAAFERAPVALKHPAHHGMVFGPRCIMAGVEGSSGWRSANCRGRSEPPPAKTRAVSPDVGIPYTPFALKARRPRRCPSTGRNSLRPSKDSELAWITYNLYIERRYLGSGVKWKRSNKHLHSRPGKVFSQGVVEKPASQAGGFLIQGIFMMQAILARNLMPDEEWAFFEPFTVATRGPGGRPAIGHWRVLEGIFWIARTGARGAIRRRSLASVARFTASSTPGAKKGGLKKRILAVQKVASPPKSNSERLRIACR